MDKNHCANCKYGHAMYEDQKDEVIKCDYTFKKHKYFHRLRALFCLYYQPIIRSCAKCGFGMPTIHPPTGLEYIYCEAFGNLRPYELGNPKFYRERAEKCTFYKERN